uniref:Pyrin domain-containing protein n=1 Tax=Lates calcarifer TaxID=8187 RepID=A0A4W6BWM4_LATCA
MSYKCQFISFKKSSALVKSIYLQILLETLNDLSHKELEKFRRLLQFTYFQKNLPQIPWSQLNMADGGQIVDLMVKRCGHQSVEVTMEVFMDMNRTDLPCSLFHPLKKLNSFCFFTKRAPTSS